MRVSSFIQFVFGALLGTVIATNAVAELYINEIYFDPGGAGQDNRDEYIELRGTPAMPLANHYLIFVEHEDNDLHTGGAGLIEDIFDLSTLSLGSNGFLLMRQDGNLYDDARVAPGTTSIEHNDGNPAIVNGWGNGSGSLAFHSGIANTGLPKTALENGGATAMLVCSDGLLAPSLNMDLDVGNDGLDPESSDQLDWRSHWTILDSIGFMERGEIELGRVYGQVNFAPEIVGEPLYDLGPILTPEMIQMKTEPGAEYVGLGFEVEMLARWGNSTGQSAADWHATNLTDNPGSGSLGVTPGPPAVIDFRQSGDPHPANDFDPNTPAPQPDLVESSQGVPYGSKLTTTLGAPNYMTGDYNGNGVIDAADFTVWRDSLDQTGTESNHPAADANHDFLVNTLDYDTWKTRFGTQAPSGMGASSSTAVPEPSAMLLAAMAMLLVAANKPRRQP